MSKDVSLMTKEDWLQEYFTTTEDESVVDVPDISALVEATLPRIQELNDLPTLRPVQAVEDQRIVATMRKLMTPPER